MNNMQAANNTKDYKSNFKFEEENLDYVVQLKKKNWKWLWLLLLLLPLLLFVKCSKDVTVQTLDEYGNVVPNTQVSFAYTAHFLYDNKTFFAHEPYQAIQVTDANGITVFKNLRYSVYSFIFYIHSKAFISARSECYAADIALLFHFICSKKTIPVKMNTIRTNLELKVIDERTKLPLEEATVYYTYTSDDGGRHTVWLKSDSNGDVVIYNIPICQQIDSICTSKKDYKDDIRNNVNVNELLKDPKKRVIPLDPIDKCTGIWVVKLSGGGLDGAEYECTLKGNNKASVLNLSFGTPTFNETYQCNGNKLSIRWAIHHGSGCTWELTGIIKGDTYSGTFKHIDTKNDNKLYASGTFTGYFKR